MRLSILKSEGGFATLVALIMVGMLTLIGLAALSTSDDEVSIASNELQEMRAFYAAEAGLEKIAAEIQDIYDSTGAPPATLPNSRDSINGCVIFYGGTDDGAETQEILTSGTLTGLSGAVKSFTLRSVGFSSLENARVVLTQSFESVTIPVFQWTLFFNDDFYTKPGGDVSIGGRVHTNGNMYVQSTGSKLTFDDQVTIAGDLQHGFPWGVPGGGDVFFTDASGNPENMKQGGVFIDSDHANWYDTAAALWQGKLQDNAFGQNELNLGLDASDDPHKIIERSTGNPDSYQDKADFMILDGTPMAKVGGIWQDVSASLPGGTITDAPAVRFYDAHEQKTVRNTQVDINLLKGSGYFP
ncbi:MAG: pilus assembly PilX N-terminal domain-containing protein, partial [candidate division Zixibacteria bacterium]|nr:pilus assembly PilX N-terminal domain-containing protein [candidate division Zixibacteria bacterium]